jgi:hypothetical protein
VASVLQQVQSADGADCQNIAGHGDGRGFLSQNLLAQLRNLLKTVLLTPRGQR